MTAFLFVTPTWDGAAWASKMRKALPGLDVRVWPQMGDEADIQYVAAWLPPTGVVKSLPNLKVIFSLGAGVDAILSDGSLPADTPIVRVNDPDLTMRMTEHVVLQVLLHHRQHARLHDNQRVKRWQQFPQHPASALRVGIMGLGVLGRDAARKLNQLGFEVLGWSRSQKTITGVTCFAGPSGLDGFLACCDILVCLLPATPDTDGILNMGLFKKLARNGPLAAPVLINAGRGRQQVEADILQALDDGTLLGASLDVFSQEPLPADSRFWHHPKVILTPHTAADSDAATICSYVAQQIIRFERDGTLENLVDRKLGY